MGPVAPCQNVRDSLTLSASSLDFGQQAVDLQSQPTILTISNPTAAVIQLKDFLVTGIDFTEQSDCSQSLAPAEHCAIKIFFKPVILGQRIGNISITGSDPSSPHFVALTGVGK
jgi:hypothetical protein